MGRLNLGALAGGVAAGYGMAQKIDIDAKREQRDAEREKREAARHDAEKAKAAKRDAVLVELADLAELFVGTYQPPAVRPAPSPVGPAAGIGPAVGIGAGTPQADPPTSTPGITLNVSSPAGVARRGITPDLDDTPPVARAEEQRGPKTADDRVGFALWRQPALFANPEFLNKAASMFLKAGMPEGVQFLERGSRAQQEGAITAVRALLQGDPAGAEAAFNATGKTKIEPGSLKPIGGGRWQATMAGTGQTQTFDPQQMLRSFLNPKDFFELGLREKKAADDAAHRDRTAAEQERHNRATEANAARNAELRVELANLRKTSGEGAETAMVKNIKFMVDKKVASSEAEAFGMLRTAMEKPEDDAVLSVAKSLMGGTGYMGKDGPARAMKDASEMVRQLKSTQAQPAAPTPAFKSANDVKAAFRAGRIDRAAAMKALTQDFGMAAE